MRGKRNSGIAMCSAEVNCCFSSPSFSHFITRSWEPQKEQFLSVTAVTPLIIRYNIIIRFRYKIFSEQNGYQKI